jgi:hypothetical protein
MSASVYIGGVQVFRSDLRTFSTKELKAMLPKAQQWTGNPFPREWIVEELHERGARVPRAKAKRS